MATTLASSSKTIGTALGPTLFLITLLLDPPGGLSATAWQVAGLGLWMASWWATEALPLAAVSLLPLVVAPLLEMASLSTLAASYAHPIIFLFFGGFMLGMAMQRWYLHRRIALLILSSVGTSARAQIGGFMVATAFLSMWVSNTATSVMMLPIALSVIGERTSDEPADRNFRVALLLGVAYSASIGGVATLIGTPPNALLAGYLKDSHQIDLGFGQWMLVGLPVATMLLLFVWWWLCRRPLPRAMDRAGLALDAERAALGPMSSAEMRVLWVFGLTAAAWIFRPLLARWLPGLDDTVIAIAATLVLFLSPAGVGGERLLSWSAAENIPWGILLLFGGGLALAGVIQSSGLAVWIANSMASFTAWPLLLVVAMVVTVILFLTEVSSNTATAAAFLPLLGALAVAQQVSPLLFAAPAALAASCAFMMPVATPPNAVVFSSGQLKIGDMIRCGLAINLVAIGVLSVVGLPLLRWVILSQ